MPEKARRIRAKKTFSLKKGRMFLALITIIFVFLIVLTFNSSPQEEVKQGSVIKDQEIVAIVCIDTNCVAINKDGVAFRKSSLPSGSLFFLLRDKTGRQELPLEEEIIPALSLKEIFYLRNKINKELTLWFNEGDIFDKNFNDFEFKTSDGWVLKLSTINNANATVEILKRVLDELGSTRFELEYIDLRISTRVYYKMK